MTLLVVLAVLMAAAYALGYAMGRRRFEQYDHGWLPPERRRWRP